MVRLTEVTTRWKLIRDIAVEHGQPGARRALDKLIGLYWLPVFSFVRGRLDEEQALEVTQDFFTDILARNDIPKFATKNDIRSKFENNELDRSSAKDQEGRPRGWFRFWLRKAARNHVIRYRKQQEAVIHGGGTTHVSVDTAEAEINRCHGQNGETIAERVVDCRRGYEFIDRVEARVRADPAYRNQPDFFEALKQFISDDTDELQRETAVRFDKTPEAIRKAVFDFKARYRKYLDEELAKSGGGVENIKEARRKLLEAVRSNG